MLPVSSLLLALSLQGCGYQLHADTPDAGAITPALVCNAQLTTTVTVAGLNLRPLPSDVLTDAPSLELPSLVIHRRTGLDGTDAEGVDTDLIAANVVRWLDEQTMEIDINPDLALEPGVYDLTVTNPDGQEVTVQGAVAVAPEPVVSAMEAALLCLEQAPRQVTLSGVDLLVFGDALPAVDMGGVALVPDGASDCYDLAGPVAGQVCETLTVTIPQDALDPGVYEVSITNPETAACQTLDPVPFEVVPRPTLSAVAPNLLCVAQGDQALTLSGLDFLVIGEALPTVDLGGVVLSPDAAEDCEALAGPVEAARCATLQLTLPQGALEPGIHAAKVLNPETAPCESTDEVLFEVVPPPVLDSLAPQPNCLEQEDRAFVATGSNFLVLADGSLPEVMVGATAVVPTAASDCVDLLGPAGGQLCAAVDFTLSADSEGPGLLQGHLTCPSPADCVSNEQPLELVPEPTLSAVTEDLICVSQGSNELVLSGADFLVKADGDLPWVAVGEDYLAQAERAENCVDLLGPGGGALCDTLRLTLPEDALAVGVHQVEVTNPASAECLTLETAPLEVVPRPSIADVRPILTCLDQGSAELLIEGADFLVLADGTLPEVLVGAHGFTPAGAEGCVALAGPSGGALCTTLITTLPQDLIEDGLHEVSVVNPAPAGCVTEESFALETRPAPTLAAIDTALTCGAQRAETFTLSGAGFLVVDGVYPTVSLGGYQAAATGADGCVDLLGAVPGYRCTSVRLEVPAGALDAGLLAVAVQNPPTADCVTMEPVALENLVAPTVTAILPESICDEAGTLPVTVEGAGFLSTGGLLPTVRIGDVDLSAEGVAGCEALTGSVAGQLCSSLTLTLPEGTFTALGTERVLVTNPAPAECVSGDPVDLIIAPPPTITATSPALSCSGGTLRVEGTDLSSRSRVFVGDAEVTVETAAAGLLTGDIPAGLPLGVAQAIRVENPGECSDEVPSALTLMPAPTLVSVDQALVCGEQLDNTFMLSGTDFLVSGGEYPVVDLGGVRAVADGVSGCAPIPDGQACTGLTVTFSADALALLSGVQPLFVQNPAPADCETNAVEVEVVGAPSVASVEPVEQCWEVGAFQVRVTGAGFLSQGGHLPAVQLGDEVFNATSVSTCASLAGPAGGQLCEELLVDVPADTWDHAQTLPVGVTNPSPAACESDEDVGLDLYDPPRVTAVEPYKVCGGDTVVSVTGTGFRATPAVEFLGLEAQRVTLLSDTELEVLIPAELDPGEYPIRVINPDTCEDTLPAPGLIVVEPPIVFFVDPPAMYSAVPIQATVYVAGINDELVEVWLEESASGAITEISPADFSWDPADPLRVQALIPADLPRGSYNVFIKDEVGCEVSFSDALFEEDTPTVAVDTISPPFGWEQGFTPVVVAGDGFVDLPRVYLSPSVPAPGTSATELTGVVWADAQTIDGIVPTGLAADTYDLIVVNPDHSVGFLAGAYQSMVDHPPMVTSAAPASVATQPAQAVTLRGDYFDSPTAQVECMDPSTEVTPTLYSAPVTGWGADWIDITVPGDAIGKSVCTVIVTNADATTDRFAAISVVSPSDNLYEWRPTQAMQEPRRAPAAVAGRVTRTLRYLYAMGGDTGTDAGALDSFEKAQVDVYGGLSPWSYTAKGEARYLPTPLTKAGVAQVGRFLYLVGGNDGISAVDSVYRAQILDPLEAPRVVNLDIAQGTGSELDGGTWSYRVAALFDPSYLANPSGETLASDPFTVRLPSLPQRLNLTLSWTEVPGATGYRIYRTPAADLGSRAEVFLADVFGGTTTSFTDDASAIPDAAVVPHQPGNLGEWAELPPLSHPRQSPQVATAQDPDDPNTWYLYVAGGASGATLYKDIEYLPVTDSSEHDQAVGSWIPSARLMSDLREAGSAWVVDDRLHTVQAPGDSWVYFGVGWKTAGEGSVSTSADVGLVQPGGELGSWASISKAINPGRAGAGVLSASNYLYAFGGQSGAPSSGGISMAIDPDAVPLLENGNNLGKQMSLNRIYQGSALESSIVFAVGGATDDPTQRVTATVDYTNF
ncbi:MAG: hypothetical protein JXX28_04290 [Deltaproteobacteria bacterium]|nr:hypothetical protein [Deltaproteobacteria bacterium]